MADPKQRIDEPTGTSTVGHEWDGIEELNTPLPRWWLWTFYLCCAWALVYTVFYPAWPGLHGATPGTTGWTSRGQLAQEMAAEQTRRAPMIRAIAETPLEALPGPLQAVAGVIPITRAFEAVRAGLEGTGPVAANLVFAGVGALIAVALAWWFALRQLRRFREEGWISRFT